MTRLVAVVVAVAAAIAVPALAATKSVAVGPQKRFGTSSLSVKRGDTVRFRWTGSLPHVRISAGPQRGQIASVRRPGTVSRRFTGPAATRSCAICTPGWRSACA